LSRWLTRDRAITFAFVALAFILAIWQRPGWATSDTKIDLYVDPVRFLSQVASVWTSTTDLGEVHSAQYSGYLWPMGPFFAVGHLIGLGAWLVQRIWLGLLYALSAWGMLKLFDALFGRPRRTLHVVGTAFFLINPYVVVFTARTSITLLGYAALPWLLLITHRGLHSQGGWRGLGRWMWAAGFALVLTSTGGGVNAAVVGWMLVGPLVLLLYEPAIGTVRWRDAWAFLAQAGVFGVLVSLWWIAPLLVHVRYGIDFLQFTEQPASIWATNSITESLRLMGYWTSYIGVGFGVSRPFFSDGAILLFNPFVVGASLLLPALALAGFAGSRRRTYTPLMLALVIVGVVIMMAGFPNGTPLRGAMLWLYQHIFVLRFARTTNKAAPLVAVGLAGLLGVGTDALVVRLRALARIQQRRLALGGAGIVLTALIVLASLPLIKGQAIDTQLEWKRIPAAWRDAGSGLDRTLPANTRALVLPGQIFAYYTWGGTLDAILPRLTSRPVAVRYETPYSDLHAVDLLTTVDDLVQQRRLVPGELAPLLNLMGVGAVITGSDDDISRSGAIDPAAAAGVLSEQLGSHPSNSYGPVSSFPPAAGDVGSSVSLPEVRRYDVSTTRGVVHVDPVGGTTILDGGAEGLADLGAFGGLPDRAPIFYAGDLSRSQMRAQAAAGANIVVTDSNRRQEFLPQSTQQNLGATLTATAPLPTNAAVINPFVKAGTNAQTVAVLRGARFLYAPTQAGELQFPEHAPIAAFDGNVSTSWVADRYLPVPDRWIEIGLNAPRNIPYVDVDPLSDSHGVVTEVDVNGIHQNVHPGWNRIPVNLRHVSVVRVTIDRVVQPKVGLGGPGGFREIRIPGVHVTQLLRPPVMVARGLAGTDLRRDSLTYVFERTTGDDPFRRNPYGTSTVLDNPADRGDAETYLDRLIFAPAARSYAARAWLYPADGTTDSELDRLAGYAGPDRFDSSARFENQPAYRASSAFGGRAAPGWIGIWQPGQAPSPWISWTTPKATTISHLRLLPPALAVRRPTVVRLSWSGGSTPPLTVGAGGEIALPSPIRASAVRLTVLSAAFPTGTSARDRDADAVGIGTVVVPGLAPVRIPTTGTLHAGCGTASVDVAGHSMSLAPAGTVQELDAGEPVSARSCGRAATMAAGVNEIRALPGPFSIDLLELRSPAPIAPAAPTGGGTVLDPGSIGSYSVNGARVSLSGRSWLVLGESFDIGWRAYCNGHSLGVPQVIDGYANGWLAPAGCRQVLFTFAPQSGVQKSYVISGVSVAALILLLLFGWRRRRRRAATVPVQRMLPYTPPRPFTLPRAAALALLLAVPIAWVFALRAGAVAFPILTIVLWRGIGAGRLTRVAVALLGIVVPILYAVDSPADMGGYNFAYSTDLIAAHWVGVAAVVLLTVALYWTMSSARAGASEPPPASPLDESDQDPVGPVEQEVVRS
jgi:arabinofuranan 3-O-arabinosyltransferase